MLSAIAAISGLYDLVVGALLLFIPGTLALLFGVPPASPRIFSDLNGLFLLAVGVGYYFPWRDPVRYRGYLWVMGPMLKGAGAAIFLLDYFFRGSPRSFLLFAASDGTLALLTLYALVASPPPRGGRGARGLGSSGAEGLGRGAGTIGLFVLVSLAASTSGCSYALGPHALIDGREYQRDRLRQLSRGLSEADVRSMIGDPLERTTHGDRVEWRYRAVYQQRACEIALFGIVPIQRRPRERHEAMLVFGPNGLEAATYLEQLPDRMSKTSLVGGVD